MSLHRRALTLGATTAALGLGAGVLPAGAGAADTPAAPSATPDGLLGLPITLPTIPVVSSLPVVGGVVSGVLGGTTSTTTSPSSPVTVPTIPVVSSLPVVGGVVSGVLGGTTAPTTLPSLPGLGALTTVLSSVPLVGGGDPTAVLAGLPALPIVGNLSGGAGADPLAGMTSLLPGLTGLVTGLPVGGLPAGTVPTGGALKPITDLLRQLAQAATGTPLASALTSLADQVDAVGDAGVSDDLLSVVASTLGSLAATPGVPTDVQVAAASLATQLAPKPVTTTTPTPTPVTTTKPTPVTTTTKPTTPPTTGVVTPKPGAVGGAPAVGSARIASLRVDRKSGKVRVTLSCPVTGPACKTFLAAYRGSSLAGTSSLVSILPGGTAAATVKLDTTARRALKRKTTKFTLSAVLPGGKLSTKSVTSKLPKAKKKVVRRG
ncbi:MAG: hypothetical protein JWM31_2474 [Solirubrobacterales bacterium]|nr:hypothetical protein [Solirubrobacterales bacterium]